MIRRMTLAVLLVALLLGSITQIVSADGMILPDLAASDYMVVRYHDVVVDIEDTFAVTSVEQEFYNPHDYQITGKYVFPVPPGAAVTDFQATFGGLRQSVIRQNTQDSNILLHNLVAERRDPSLLQYTNWETLTFDIILPARSSRKMTLSYQEIIAPSGGMLHYQYVLSTERYSAQPLEHASMTVNITSSRGIGSIYSSSHSVITENIGEGHTKVTWEELDTQPVNDFHLFISPAEGGFGGGFLTGRHKDTDHFLFMFAPERGQFQTESLAKDIVFIIDRSGSMAGDKIHQAQDALHYILDRLNENDRFSIVGFDDEFKSVADVLLPVNAENINTAHYFVSAMYDRNGTNIEGALQIGLEILKQSESREGASQMIVFLTDGLPTAGITDPQLIVDQVSRTNSITDARIHVFGVGYDVNTHLLDQLADKNGGSVTYVQPGENLEVVLSDFYERVAFPVLTDISIKFEGISVNELYPKHIPDLFRGSTLLLTGQYHTDNNNQTASIIIIGKAGDKTYTTTYDVSLDDVKDMAFVPGLWATRRIGHLLDIIRTEGETAPLVEEVRELGLDYGLVTPYTTFIITAQTDGAASAENMALYGNKSELNRVSGQTTIQARLQNQSYQQAVLVDLARGANVLNNNGQNLVQLAGQNIDLTLLRKYREMEQLITDEWIASNIHIDRKVSFGSKAYFELAADPVARAFMQSGNNVIFVFEGKVIEIEDNDSSVDSGEHNLIQESPTQNYDLSHIRIRTDLIRLRISQFFSSIIRYLLD